MKHALVVEDLPGPAEWLAATLGEAFPGITTTVAGSLSAGREAIRSQTPDLALIDLGLPDGDGAQLIRPLLAQHPRCACVVTTIYADDRHLFPALRAGAAGYLLKDQPREKVISALRGILAGEPPLSPAIAQRLLRLFGDTHEGGEEQNLTPRERETLVLLAKGFKLRDVAQQMGVTQNTAAGFVKIVYRKLNVSNRAEAAVEAARMGLINTKF